VQVWDAARVLIKAAEPLTTSDTKTVAEWTRQMATLPQASKLATRILLLTLLFEVIHLHNSSENIPFYLLAGLRLQLPVLAKLLAPMNISCTILNEGSF